MQFQSPSSFYLLLLIPLVGGLFLLIQAHQYRLFG